MRTMKDYPGLGAMIRSLRLGYRIYRERFFLRISQERSLYRIDVAPLLGVGKSKTLDGHHFCWWEGDQDSLVESIKPLRSVLSVKKPISFLITETGDYAGK